MLLVDPMLRHGVLPLAIATMALAIGIKEAVKQFFSAEASPFPSIVPTGDISIFGRPSRCKASACWSLAILAVFGLTALLNRTSLGHQMQAAAQNPTVARIIGVPVERMILLTFLINAFLVALASLLITPIYLAKFSSGEVLGRPPSSRRSSAASTRCAAPSPAASDRRASIISPRPMSRPSTAPRCR